MDVQNAALGHYHVGRDSLFRHLSDHAPAERPSTRGIDWAGGEEPFQFDGEWQLSATLIERNID